MDTRLAFTVDIALLGYHWALTLFKTFFYQQTRLHRYVYAYIVYVYPIIT